ncbi:MAG: hypothetical protein Q7R65_02490, partial [bacterium]|nr:hypothetical protein [bacterium]
YIKEVEFMELSSLSSEISKIISGFILTSEERVSMFSCSQRPSRSQTIGQQVSRGLCHASLRAEQVPLLPKGLAAGAYIFPLTSNIGV